MPSHTKSKQGNLMFLRLAITVQTVAVFMQAITAGLLLSSPSGEALHRAGAYGTWFVVLLHVIAAILAWRPGGGSPKPILYAVGFLVAVSAQVALGIAQVKAVHVPLGALMFGMSVLQLVQIRTERRAYGAAAA
ncbi:hypothetical protein ACQP25_35095 [Microtetraspora malaysiensis]|uniref:hypothetical protein n=1 Tax=Microtetraspora malaysiensis TaxID=161358 RepID=UPI003D93A7A0